MRRSGYCALACRAVCVDGYGFTARGRNGWDAVATHLHLVTGHLRRTLAVVTTLVREGWCSLEHVRKSDIP